MTEFRMVTQVGEYRVSRGQPRHRPKGVGSQRPPNGETTTKFCMVIKLHVGKFFTGRPRMLTRYLFAVANQSFLSNTVSV